MLCTVYVNWVDHRPRSRSPAHAREDNSIQATHKIKFKVTGMLRVGTVMSKPLYHITSEEKCKWL